MAQEPPPYSSRRQPRSALPAYLANSASASTDSHSTLNSFRCQHQYSLETSKRRPWVTLSVHSRSPHSNLLPLFFEHDVICGSVSLDLVKPDGIRGVNITLQAGTTTLGHQPEVFLETTQTLWSQSSGKLQGSYAWTFSISIPSTVTMAEGRNTPHRTYPVPPRFSERGSVAHIDYKLIVTIRRGMLAFNSTLGTNFVYLPKSVAEPPSALRTIAYREGTPLIGPMNDPEGWKVLDVIEVKGSLYASKAVSVRCTLAIAAPLCYATNTSVPLHLAMESVDSVAVDILSRPQVIVVRLVRTLAIHDNSMLHASNSFDDYMGRAVFWPTNDRTSQPGHRTLWGELHLKKGLKPSFIFREISLQYAIALYPFQVVGFNPASPHRPLSSQQVTIALVNPPGIRFRSYAPPRLVAESDADFIGSPNSRFHFTGDMDTYTMH